MNEDTVDRLVDQWKREHPEMDLAPMSEIARFGRVWRHIEERLSAVLAESELLAGEFDVLASLRRSGRPFRLSPTALVRNLMLSPAAMTNRLDRLQERGLVRRLPDPNDRRALLIELTDAGFQLVERALPRHVENQRELLAIFDRNERADLDALMRKFLAALEAATRD